LPSDLESFVPLVARSTVIAIIAFAFPGVTFGQTPATPPGTPAPPQGPTISVTVTAPTPLPGLQIPLDRIAAPVQTATDRDIDRAGSLDLSSFLATRLNGVHVNEMQGNPYQADVNYRGFTASPLLGTPQGLSLYMDGVRLNQPFGDVVSWDLIPKQVIATTTLMPGSNPLFGLNTLGGAIALETKSGLTHKGTVVEGYGGSAARRAISFEHGGARANGPDWYVAGNWFADDGWRDASPSDVRQFFGRLGFTAAGTRVDVSTAFADNSLTGNGVQEQRFLARDRSSIYTKPDTTDTRSTLVNGTFRRAFSTTLAFSGNAYFRAISTDTLNGDLNEDSLDQSVYQPTAAEQAALRAAGYTGFPTSGANAQNTPFPYWRCIAQGLLNDEPAEKCTGLINSGASDQKNGGVAGQLTWVDRASDARHQLSAGAAYDHSSTGFTQATELGYLIEDRGITGIGAYGDGVTGGETDGAPFDTRVDLDGTTSTFSVFGTDTMTFARAWHLTLSGRYDRTSLHNRDGINPGGGSGSLDGDHTFGRFNPSAGLTFNPSASLGFYGGVSQGSRAPTSIELGCADPETPCKLPNAMAGDPPLDQVVTTTWEGGVRGMRRGTTWSAGVFRADTRDDILFVLSGQTGFGYFRNFGQTQRAGLELSAGRRLGRVQLGAGYTYLRATYQSEEIVNGESNSTNDQAEAGRRGFDGAIEIGPGNRMPLIPSHQFKAHADIDATSALSFDVEVVAMSGSFARGNENNAHEPDGAYYLGPGRSEPYAVVNLGIRYRLFRQLEAFGQINNVFGTDYATAALLGATGFTSDGNYIARPFPAVGGEFPIQHATFYAPGAPITAWGGVRLRF
jgi:outer membrane receptor protein involved in Fe transport